nr:hypothetical protein BaRGS_003145 [Batillaria attramentaria]
MEGQLLKYTNVMKGWQTRWFILDPESGMLEYFEKEEHKKQRPRGSVHLAAAIVSPSDEDSQTFAVTAANGEAFKLRASDARERQHWVDRLRCTAEYHTANIAQYQKRESTPAKRLDALGGQKSHYSSQESVQSTSSKRYTPTSLPAPFLEVQEYLTEAHDYSQTLSEKIATLPYHGDDCFMTGLDKDLLMLKATTGATLKCVEQCLTLLRNGQVSSAGNVGVTQSFSLPTQLNVKKPPPPPLSLSVPAALDMDSQQAACVDMLATPDSYVSAASTTQDVPINHDEEVEDSATYCESDLGEVEEHKSVILHLLSQLKLGMDLTKVVLPTFILERRSLLEMFADCMAHPDIFLSIPDCESPQDRMLAVVEWYLTSFHAGRQGSVAKKPYNPIIGEHFHCSWELPSESPRLRRREMSVDATPSPQKGQSADSSLHLIYTAEQVSHHPPVSAFYFECPEKNMCMNGSIYTKSKFMGMSIGVVMVGKVTLKLLDYDEEYVFNLPSAYARSILTVPWAELGDKTTITCEKTNLTSNIVFHTKPFYGGKLHRVTAEVKNQTTGTIICKVTGEWNGTYEFTYSDLEERQREGERHRHDTGTQFPTKSPVFHTISG